MIKTVVSVILAIVCAWFILKLIGLLFTVAFVLLKVVMVAIIAVPTFFAIRKLLAKF